MKNEETFLFIFVPKKLSPAKKLLGEKTGTLVKVDLVTGIRQCLIRLSQIFVEQILVISGE